ncbi:MAG: putative peptide modification system cyclase [Proteobacteria bacterium]|nr:putative peptide modification system cyclase [Pseudomonadota bacterium]
MTAEIHQLETTPGPGRLATPMLRTLVVCDIADSTALVERMGDQSAAKIIRKHDRLARALVEQHKGREIDKTDGFLLLFDRPVQAAAFALDYQRGLRHMSAAEGVVVRARVGIHMGDVVIWENAPEDVARGAKPIEVEGLVKPVAARLAQLAKPQQILMSSAAAGIAHRAEGELGAEAVRHVHWKDHGKYRFKGLPEPLDVVEVGEEGIAPLHSPKSGRTARKILPWWRRPLTLAAEAAVLAIAVGVTAWFLLQSPPTLAFSARDWVVVGNVQNHTNQEQLGTPLDAAFKIGLEQSQYVNVIPDMQVDSALKRMEKPADTPVNRVIGSDVAMREGARALILPSLAQIGGKIQISAEVIDPHTGVTVYSDSTQADSELQILPATDRLLGKLRGRLGESLASIQKTSLPLAQITTSNMDALRAYGEAEKDIGQGRIGDAQTLLDQAVRLDPEFAMAWLRLATLQLAYKGDPQAAYASIQKAESSRDRLSTRERLEADGVAATFKGAGAWIDAWKGMTQMYPDDLAGHANLGEGYLWYEHNLPDAIAQFKVVAESRHPLRGFGWYLLAMAGTEQGNYRAADAAVAEGRKLGTLAPGFEDVLPDLAQRKYADVEARLNAVSSKVSTAIAVAKPVMFAAVAVDQGHDAAARQVLSGAVGEEAASVSPELKSRLAVQRVALDLATQQPDADDALKRLVDAQRARISDAGPADDGSAAIDLALAAMLAVRHGLPKTGQNALDAARKSAQERGYYASSALWHSADCEVKFADAAKDRIACLLKLVDGREYTQTHMALMLAYQADGDGKNARAQAQWLLDHRGQAIAELPEQTALIPNLLALKAAEKQASVR